MYYTYIIQSEITKKYYIGSTQNIEERLKRHNADKTKSIAHRGPFVLLYKEAFQTRQEAYRREKVIKRYHGGNAFKKLICQDGRVDNRNSL